MSETNKTVTTKWFSDTISPEEEKNSKAQSNVM